MNNKLTGFDLLLFINYQLMSISRDVDTDDFVFAASEDLAASLSEQVGFEVSQDVLQQILAQFAEYASSIQIELSPNEGEAQ